MKLIKKISGRTVLSMNREEWVQLGKNNGWKVAQVPPQTGGGLPPVAANPAGPAPTGAPAEETFDPAQAKKEHTRRFQQSKTKMMARMPEILKVLKKNNIVLTQQQLEGVFTLFESLNEVTGGDLSKVKTIMYTIFNALQRGNVIDTKSELQNQ